MSTDNHGHQVPEDHVRCEDCGALLAKPHVAHFPGGFIEVFPENVRIILHALDLDFAALSLHNIPADEDAPWPMVEISIPLHHGPELHVEGNLGFTTVRYDVEVGGEGYASEELTHP